MIGLVPIVRVEEADGIEPFGGRAGGAYAARCVPIVGVIGNLDMDHTIPTINVRVWESVSDHEVGDVARLRKNAFMTSA